MNDINDLAELKTDIEKAEYLQNILIDQATGGASNNNHYVQLRAYFIETNIYSDLVPRFVKTNRNLSQFWQFIKFELKTYQQRRDYIWGEFRDLMDFLETKSKLPAEKMISNVLDKFDSESIIFAWQKALERKNSDPEGAITLSRTIVESVCKHILENENVEYNASGIDLSELYKLVAKQLNMAPEQHQEQIFKQILGGCSSIISGLSGVRNRLGDAHGKGKNNVKPSERHAELSVNLAGAMAMFIIQTYEENRKKKIIA